MQSSSNGVRLPPPWITPAAGKVDREVRPVITVSRRRPPSGGIIATGGVESVINVGGINYKVHLFSVPGTYTFDVTNGGPNLEYLIAGAAGGASRSQWGGGGAGAGGYRCSVPGEQTGGGLPAEPRLIVTPQQYIVVIGLAGLSATSSNFFGTRGGDSSFAGITGLGGGPGGVAGGSYGSGGGASYAQFSGQGAGPAGAGTTGQGCNGGGTFDRGASYGGGGGGGAAQPGNGQVTNADGRGGDGITSAITGTPRARCGGGSGGLTLPPNALGADGPGGGGRGSIGSSPASVSRNGEVIIRYPI
jgi:hypothetical protein